MRENGASSKKGGEGNRGLPMGHLGATHGPTGTPPGSGIYLASVVAPVVASVVAPVVAPCGPPKNKGLFLKNKAYFFPRGRDIATLGVPPGKISFIFQK